MAIEEFPPDELRIVQARAGGREASHVAQLVDTLKQGKQVPACEAKRDVGGLLHLWDGDHRVEAYRQCGMRVPVNVEPGSLEDAQLAAASANATHGLRRTNADKRRAVETVLMLRPLMSNRQIAEHCGLSHTFVASIREHNEVSADVREGRDGRKRRTRSRTGQPQEGSNTCQATPKTTGKRCEQVQRSNAPAERVPPAQSKSAHARRAVEDQLYALYERVVTAVGVLDDDDRTTTVNEWRAARSEIDRLLTPAAKESQEGRSRG